MVEERKLPITIILQTISNEALRQLEQQVDRLGNQLRESLGKGVTQAENFERASTKSVRRAVDETDKIGKTARRSFEQGARAAENFATRFVGPLDPVIRLLRNLGKLTVLPFVLGIEAVRRFALIATGSISGLFALFRRLATILASPFAQLALGFRDAFAQIISAGPGLASKALGPFLEIASGVESVLRLVVIQIKGFLGSIAGAAKGVVDSIIGLLGAIPGLLPIIGGIGKAFISALTIPIKLAAELGRVLGDVLQQVISLGSELAGTIGRAFSAFVGAAVIGITSLSAAVFFLTKRLSQMDDELIKTAQRVGVGVTELSALSLAARESNLDIRQVAIGLQQTSKLAADASIGIGRAAGVYKQFGIDLDDGTGNVKRATQLIRELSDSFAELEDGPEKVQLAGRALGDEFGPRLIPLLNLGSKEIDRLIDRAVDLGEVISEDAAEAIAEFNNTITEFLAGLRGLGRALVDGLRPALNQLFKDLTDFAVRIRPQIVAALRTLPTAIDNIVPAVQRSFRLLFSGGEGAQALRESLLNTLQVVSAAAIRVASATGNAISIIFKAFVPAIKLFLQEAQIVLENQIGNILDQAAEKGIELGSRFGESLLSGLRSALVFLGDKIFGRLPPVLDSIELGADALGDRGEQAIAKVRDRYLAAFNALQEGVERSGGAFDFEISIVPTVSAEEIRDNPQVTSELQSLAAELERKFRAEAQVSFRAGVEIDEEALRRAEELQARVEFRNERQKQALDELAASSGGTTAKAFSDAATVASAGLSGIFEALGVGAAEVKTALVGLADVSGLTAAFSALHAVYTAQLDEQIEKNKQLKEELRAPQEAAIVAAREIKGLDAVLSGTELGADMVDQLTESITGLALEARQLDAGSLLQLSRASKELERSALVQQLKELSAQFATTANEATRLQALRIVNELANLQLEPKQLVIEGPEQRDLLRIFAEVNEAISGGIDSDAIPGLIDDIARLNDVAAGIDVDTNMERVRLAIKALEIQAEQSGERIPEVFLFALETLNQFAQRLQTQIRIPTPNIQDFRVALVELQGDIDKLSPADLVGSVQEFNDALSAAAVTEALRANAQFMEDFGQNLERAPFERVKEFAANLQLIADQRATENFAVGFAAQVADSGREFEKLGLLGKRIARDLEGAFSNFFNGLISREIRNLSDAFRKLGEDILKFIGNAISQALANQATSGIGSIISAIFPSTAPAAQGGVVSTFATGGVMKAAAGGVLGGSSAVPERVIERARSISPEALQRGGVAREPQLALFAEANKAEAFVPLEDGRNIPVRVDVRGRAIVPLPGGREIPVQIEDVRDALGIRSLQGRRGGTTAAAVAGGGVGSGGAAAAAAMQFGGVLESAGRDRGFRRALALGGRVAASVAVPFLTAALAVGPADAAPPALTQALVRQERVVERSAGTAREEVSRAEVATQGPLGRLEGLGGREPLAGGLSISSSVPRFRAPQAEAVGLAAAERPLGFSSTTSSPSVSRGAEEVVRLLSVPTGAAQRGLDQAIEERREAAAGVPTILAAQSGAVVREPTLLLAGEGGRSEAIVPLQDGGIPVRVSGPDVPPRGGGAESAPPPQPIVIQFTVLANDTRGFDQLLASRQSVITRLVEEAAVTRQSTRQTLDVRR